jgi:LysM repeat protein
MLSIKIKIMLKGIKITLFFVLATVSIAFCNSETSAINEAYVNKFKEIAVREMHRTGIPASIKLAQAILESGAGTSELAKEANNHFGIKCGGSWKGKTFHKKDDDRNKIGVKIKSCFREYANPEESFKAHSEFLMNPSKKDRYGFLFDYKSTDYKSWAKGLKKAGYATNPKYPKLLMQVIEENELHQYDNWKLSDIKSDEKTSKPSKKPFKPKKEKIAPKKEVITEAKPTKKIKKEKENIEEVTRTNTKQKEVLKKENKYDKNKSSIESRVTTSSTKQSNVFYSNDIRAVSVEKGDTPENIAEKYNVPLSKLLVYNEIEFNSVLQEGDFIYLQPKRKSYRGKKSYHIVYEESMHDIAQRYGIQLSELCEKNLINIGQEPRNGQRVNLKTKRKDSPKLKGGKASEDKKLEEKLNASIENTKSKIAEVSDKIDEKITFKYPKHIVKKGETLFSISKKYEVSVEDVRKWNSLKTSTLEVGQELIIKKR